MSASKSRLQSLRRHAARVLLVTGIAVGASVFLPALPEDQTVVFRLPERTVRTMSATFTARDDDEPLGGVTLSFDGEPPREVRHRVALPKGEYLLAIELGHGEARAKETSSVHRVNLQGGVTTVFVEDR